LRGLLETDIDKRSSLIADEEDVVLRIDEHSFIHQELVQSNSGKNANQPQ
jgi:hypothetical protein